MKKISILGYKHVETPQFTQVTYLHNGSEILENTVNYRICSSVGGDRK
jgi:hypothetical protein